VTSFNKVILIGNLTRDPEIRQAPSGQYVCTFGIATNREWITSTGERKTSTEFHDLVAWARLGEICRQYLKKGKLIYVEGYLKTRSWETPEAVKKYKTEIIIQDMIILEKRPKDAGMPPLPIADDMEITNSEESFSSSVAVDIDKDLGL
jgi:single-strand DNA-binding protein